MKKRFITIKFFDLSTPDRVFAIYRSTRPSASDGVLAACDEQGECHYFPMVNVKEWHCWNEQ